MKLTTDVARTLALPAGKDGHPKTDHLEHDDVIGGFALRLRAGRNGITRTWVYQYDLGGRTRRLTLGDATVLGAEEARRSAARQQAQVRLGQDPARARTEARVQAAQSMGAVLPAYLADKRPLLRPRSFVEVERHLDQALRALHPLPLAEITTDRLAAQLTRIAKTSGTTAAFNTGRSASAFFTWAFRKGLIAVNPMVGIEQRKPRARTRVLSAAEIKAVWTATAGADDFSCIIRLLLLTGCRAAEVGGLRWSEVYSDRIVLPGERTKNGRPHVVPLVPATQAILAVRKRESGQEFVFGRMASRPFSGWSGSKQALDARIHAAGVKVPPWTVHDLRRSFVTGCNELGVPPHIVEAAVNHTSGFRNGIAGHYNFAAYEIPIRNALTRWADYVQEIIEGRVAAGDRVVPLRA
jgi:integrase